MTGRKRDHEGGPSHPSMIRSNTPVVCFFSLPTSAPRDAARDAMRYGAVSGASGSASTRLQAYSMTVTLKAGSGYTNAINAM